MTDIDRIAKEAVQALETEFGGDPHKRAIIILMEELSAPFMRANKRMENDQVEILDGIESMIEIFASFLVSSIAGQVKTGKHDRVAEIINERFTDTLERMMENAIAGNH